MVEPQQMAREGVAMTSMPVVAVQGVVLTPSAAPTDPTSLLQGVTSVKFGPAGSGAHRHFPGQGAGPFGKPPFGIAGASPLTDQEGKLIATLNFSSTNRDMGQLSAQLLLPDGRLFAQIERPVRQATFAMAQDPSTVFINGAHYATVDSGKSGRLQRADGSGGIAFNAPCCQPACKWLAFAFCCFFPTIGIASCYAMCQLEKAGRLVNLSSVDGAPGYAPLMFMQVFNEAMRYVVVDFGKYPVLDERSKLDLVLLLACHHCADHCDSEGGGGGGGGGGP